MAYDYDRYQRYIASTPFQEKRAAVRERCGGVCERCGCCPMEHCAHLTYDRLYDEPLTDLAGLCADCHAFIDGETDDDHVGNVIADVEASGRIVGDEAEINRWLDNLERNKWRLTINWRTESHPWDIGKSLRRDRPTWPAICADCGTNCRVPFEPKSPYVRCRDCLRAASMARVNGNGQE